ncbi:MAG: DegT/DnrJ/EryC1/StrS family aminotransferase [Chloroflexi bacterium]|nr:DegT/DnrJ/EryC1/StrS family aminotransferase [Chloroflexota bacterium]
MRATDRLNETLTAALLRRQTGRGGALLLGRAAAGIWATLRVFNAAGRPVLIPANTCYIVLWAVLLAEAQPVLVDTDPTTGMITPATLDAALEALALGQSPVAVIPCHLYGLPAPMAAITTWAGRHDLRVIEDAAQAFGGNVDGRPMGAWGDAAVFSFGAGKIVDLELGGALLADDPALLDAASALLAKLPVYGDALAGLDEQWLSLYWAMHQYEEANPRLPALYTMLFDLYQRLTHYRAPASLWRAAPAAFEALAGNLAHRAAMANLYDAQFADLPEVHTLSCSPETTLWKYPLRTPAADRNELLRFLWGNGIETATRWYPSLQAMAAALAPQNVQPPTPHADALSREIINLPVDASVDAETAARIAGQVREFYRAAP